MLKIIISLFFFPQTQRHHLHYDNRCILAAIYNYIPDCLDDLQRGTNPHQERGDSSSTNWSTRSGWPL